MNSSQIQTYIFKSLGSGILKNIVVMLVGLLSTPLIVKAIGLEEYGYLSMVLLFTGFSGVFDLGLSKSIVELMSKSSESITQELNSIFILNYLATIATFLFSLIVYLCDLNLLRIQIANDHMFVRLLNCSAVLLLSFSIFTNMQRAKLEARFKLEYVNYGFLIQSTFISVGWLLLALSKKELSYYLIPPIVSSLTVILFYLKFDSINPLEFKGTNRQALIRVFRTTFKYSIVGTLNSIHLPLIKYIVVLLLGDGRAVGIFELSTKLSLIANNTMSYITNPFFSLSAKYGESSKHSVLSAMARMLKFSVVASLFGYCIYLLANRYIISFFFKDYSNEIFAVLSAILFSFILLAISDLIQKYMMGRGCVAFVTLVKLISVCLNLIFIVIMYLLHGTSLITIVYVYAISVGGLGLFWIFYFLIIFRRKTHV